MDNSFGNTNNNSWRSSQRSSGLTKNSRFDSLHSDEYKTVRRQRNNNPPQESTSKLFSVNNTSLADFIPDVPKTQQKYVSPAMRRQTQLTPPRPRNQFTSARKKKKPVLNLSGTSFPMIGASAAPAAAPAPAPAAPAAGASGAAEVNYKAAAAMNDDDYDTKKREEDKHIDDTTEFNDADRLGSIVDDNNEEDIGFRDPVCPYEAGEAALYMIKSYQHKRDEQNELLGAQSPYWNMKSLLDFTTDDEDSNYASSSESETENNGSDADYY